MDNIGGDRKLVACNHDFNGCELTSSQKLQNIALRNIQSFVSHHLLPAIFYKQKNTFQMSKYEDSAGA